jgi:pyridinium-3,5-biscarboxylic acid mononucleotide sulfurtransferase
MEIVQQKLIKLNELLKNFESVAIGFSGGVDSTFLAAAAAKVLGEKAVAVTAYSPTLPESEKQETVKFAEQIGIRHVLLSINELGDENFVVNNAQRCYFCKKTRFSEIARWANNAGYDWVLEGSNADDAEDYRPGMKAVEELNKVASPLLEAGLTKNEIRQLSKEWGLPAWDKPSAACLSSRVAYGEKITAERLSQIEQAEGFIKRICPGQVRVRHHGNLARIEVDVAQIDRFSKLEVRQQVAGELQKLGFTFVTLDLTGYYTGSMNAVFK